MTISVLSSTASFSLSPPSSSATRSSCSPQHIHAQRLNNTAATCIEIGQYDQAITILAKALRFREQEQQEKPEQEQPAGQDNSNKCHHQVCSCHYCSVDGCIVSSEDDYCSDNDDNNDDHCNDCNVNEDNSDGYYIYKRPIYVYEGHNMGSTLFHIIAFNLAIAHHLIATASSSKDDDEENVINKALQFYELAYECNHRLSVRFDMIICNNLSHIYRHQEQKEQHKRCVEELCTNVFIAVDQNKQKLQQQQQQQQQHNATTEDDEEHDIQSLDLDFEYMSEEEEQEEYRYNSSLSTITSSTISTNKHDTPLIDINEGFLDNVSRCSSSLLKEQQQEQQRGGEFFINDNVPQRSAYINCSA